MGRRAQQKKTKTTERREVRRQHIWTPGHDPNDPDAYPESGWTYAKLVPEDSDPTNKTNRHTLAGGPESGFPCVHCGEMTRIADEYKVEELLDAVFSFTPEQRQQIADKKVKILVCPKCEALTQFRSEILEPMREAWLRRQEQAA